MFQDRSGLYPPLGLIGQSKGARRSQSHGAFCLPKFASKRAPVPHKRLVEWASFDLRDRRWSQGCRACDLVRPVPRNTPIFLQMRGRAEEELGLDSP